MIIIYTKRCSARLLYTARHIFEHVLGVDYRVSENLNGKNDGDIVLTYGFTASAGELSMYASDILFEDTGPHIDTYHKIIEKPWPYFKAPFGSFDFCEDVFALCFFSISRYEEYVLPIKDKYGRFRACDSVFSRDKVLQTPHVDTMIFEFARKIQSVFHQFQFSNKKTKKLLTIDVDHAWKYRNKGFIRHLAAFGKNVLQLRLDLVAERMKVLTGILPDPYFSFDQLDKLSTLVEMRYFILLGDYNKIDINIHHKSMEFRQLLSSLSDRYPVGIHPSSKSSNNTLQLIKERKRLEEITKKPIYDSRQHFLLLTMPGTYHALLEAGITDDYTMGFADNIGFRAGTAFPFYWFDLSTDTETRLLVHPFVAMDVTIRDYLNLKPSEAFGKMKSMLDGVKQNGGTFTLLWHNSSFTDAEGWSEWKSGLVEFFEGNQE